MRTRPTLLIAGCAAFAVTGCDWNSFNSLLDEAPVVVASVPGKSTTSAFVLPLPIPAEAGTNSAARMLVSRTDSDYLAVADFDMNGKVGLTEITERSSLRGSPVVSAAVRADGMILLGVPGFGGGATPVGSTVSLVLTAMPGGGYSSVMQPGVQATGSMSRVGLGVAAGNVTGVATGDFVVVGDNSVQVVGGDGKTAVASTSCPSVNLLSTEFYPFRPLAVGDLITGGYDEIVVGGNGRVALLRWNGTNTVLCPDSQDSPQSYLTMGASLDFGSSVAVGYFNNDGNKDLAVGSPPDRVFVYFGPLDPYVDPVNPVATPSVTITNRLPNTKFGQRIAAYQAPGAATAQLLVADPAAPVGSFTGRVMLFDVTASGNMTDADAVATLFDSREDADGGLFGMNLGGLTFNPQLCSPAAPVQLVPWATNHRALLTFFNYPRNAAVSDPRCFVLKP